MDQLIIIGLTGGPNPKRLAALVEQLCAAGLSVRHASCRSQGVTSFATGGPEDLVPELQQAGLKFELVPATEALTGSTGEAPAPGVTLETININVLAGLAVLEQLAVKTLQERKVPDEVIAPVTLEMIYSKLGTLLQTVTLDGEPVSVVHGLKTVYEQLDRIEAAQKKEGGAAAAPKSRGRGGKAIPAPVAAADKDGKATGEDGYSSQPGPDGTQGGDGDVGTEESANGQEDEQQLQQETGANEETQKEGEG